LTPLDPPTFTPALRDFANIFFDLGASKNMCKGWIGFSLRDGEILSLFQEQWCVKYKRMKIGLRKDENTGLVWQMLVQNRVLGC
jgi:hypothetical protein